jgi:hypothetical protein
VLLGLDRHITLEPHFQPLNYTLLVGEFYVYVNGGLSSDVPIVFITFE